VASHARCKLHFMGTHITVPPEISASESTIIYDGDCPFCSRYVSLLRLRKSLGSVTLLNARDGGPLVDAVRGLGFDLDEGMVLVMNGEIFHGADCLHRLALLTTSSGAFNRLNAWMFRSRVASQLLYPVLRAGRNAALSVLGREKIGEQMPQHRKH
jgi:predicted DCC family thiol-disulfide oxidoreductase YuxK